METKQITLRNSFLRIILDSAYFLMANNCCSSSVLLDECPLHSIYFNNYMFFAICIFLKTVMNEASKTIKI